MIVLEAAETIYGVASAATSITYTLTGDETTSTPTDTFKKLAQGTLPSSAGLLYTVPASTATLVKSIHLANTTNGAITGVQIFVGGSAAANAITGPFTIPAYGWAVYAQGGWQVFTSSGQFQTAGATGPQGATGPAGLLSYFGENGEDGADGLPSFANPYRAAIFTVGYAFVPYSGGTISTGTYTPNPLNGNYQYIVNGGAFTLANPAIDCAIDILVTNNGSAGAITFSTFSVGSSTGDALDTTNAHKFIVSIRCIDAVSTYLVKALQ